MESRENFEGNEPEETSKPVVEILENQIESVVNTVEARVNNPEDQTAEATVQLSTGAQIKEAISHHFKENGKITWSTVKAVGVGALSLIPILGGAGEVASAELIDAAVLEGASVAEAGALSKGAVVAESGKVVTPLIKILGEKGAEKVIDVVKKLDPFEDVPKEIVMASGAAEALGLEGAGVIPAAIQIVINQGKSIKEGISMGVDVGKIILNSPEAQKAKDYVTTAKNKIRSRLDKANTSNMAMAAQVFQPSLA